MDEESCLHAFEFAVAGALKSSLPASPRLPWAPASPFSTSPLPHLINPSSSSSSSSLHKAPAIHSITPKRHYHSTAEIDIISPLRHTRLHDNSIDNRRGYSNPAYNYEKPSSKSPGDSSPCEPNNKFCIFLPHFKKSRSLNAGADLNVTDKARRIKDNGLHPNLCRTISFGGYHLSANSSGRRRPPALASNSLGGRPPVPKPNVGSGRPHITSKSSPLHSFYKQRKEDERMLSLKTSLPYRTSLLGC